MYRLDKNVLDQLQDHIIEGRDYYQNFSKKFVSDIILIFIFFIVNKRSIGAIIVYDVTKKDSLDHVSKWI